MTPGCLFVALPGSKTDGHRYIRQALERGAAAVLCQRPPEGEGPWLVTEDTRAALAAEHASNPELVANLPLEPWMFVTLTDFSPDEVPYLTLTDGSTLTLNDLGYATPTPLTEELDQCRLQFIFNEVLPLDTVASITIGDLTIPLPDA